MKWAWFCGSSFVAILAGIALAAASLGEQGAKPVSGQAPLLLAPLFSTALDGPEFTLNYRNDTSEPVDIIDLLAGSYATLDGRVYPRTSVAFVGNPDVAPGQTWAGNVSLAEYIPGWEKKAYSETLKRWRWKIPLDSGRHTLSVTLGAKEYGPIAFVWKGDVALLYE